jgi:unsaturated rhamnogalacturonyl hydrolase
MPPVSRTTDSRVIARALAQGTINLRYREWNWGEGVSHLALFRAYQVLNAEEALVEVQEFLAANRDFYPDDLIYSMPGWVALLAYEATGDELGLRLAERLIKMLADHPRTDHGAFRATRVRSVWVDYIYETTPFLCEYARVSGDRTYRDWAVDQTIAYLMACWNPRVGLFDHVYYDSTGLTNGCYWARATGWAMLGLVQLIEMLPQELGMVPTMRRILERAAKTLTNHQADSGLWHTVVLDPETHLETCASVMISLALRRASRTGLIAASYEDVADRAWNAVANAITSEGLLEGVSAETPPGDAQYYDEIPRGVYPWGQGFALLAALDRVADA